MTKLSQVLVCYPSPPVSPSFGSGLRLKHVESCQLIRESTHEKRKFTSPQPVLFVGCILRVLQKRSAGHTHDSALRSVLRMVYGPGPEQTRRAPPRGFREIVGQTSKT